MINSLNKHKLLISFRFPNYKIHDDEYCKLFVKYIRQFIRNEDVIIEERKMGYLFSLSYGRNKSYFLNKIGYNENDINKLINDIRMNTDFKTSTFKVITKFTFNFEAKTILNNYIVTTAWQLNNDGNIRLITLIPGGDKKWKKE